MELDIDTKKGQESLIFEREVQEIIKNSWNVNILETPKNTSAKCDGFLYRDNNMLAVFETKCRFDMTYSELLERGSWLITYEKILGCKRLSEYLQIPFLGFLYLCPRNSNERVLLFWKITDNKGNYFFDFEIQKQETQKTINGGLITRENAYLPVESSEFVRKK